jgi:hypothetical protein
MNPARFWSWRFVVVVASLPLGAFGCSHKCDAPRTDHEVVVYNPAGGRGGDGGSGTAGPSDNPNDISAEAYDRCAKDNACDTLCNQYYGGAVHVASCVRVSIEGPPPDDQLTLRIATSYLCE